MGIDFVYVLNYYGSQSSGNTYFCNLLLLSWYVGPCHHSM